LPRLAYFCFDKRLHGYLYQNLAPPGRLAKLL
jgi:hypothetical protein